MIAISLQQSVQCCIIKKVKPNVIRFCFLFKSSRKGFYSTRGKILLPSSLLELSEEEKRICGQGKLSVLWTAACRFHKEYKKYIESNLNDDVDNNNGDIYARIAEIAPFSQYFEQWTKLQNVNALILLTPFRKKRYLKRNVTKKKLS